MQIFVKLADGATVTLQVEPDNTIEDVKAKIRAKKRVVPGPVERISWGGKDLVDGYMLRHYNI